jgi:hypothetical protein
MAHALALVRLRRPVATDVGGNLTDTVLVRTLDDDFGLAGRFDRNPCRDGVLDRVREAQREVQDLALGLRAITDADQFKLALKTFRHAVYHVGQQCTRRSARGIRRLDFRVALNLHDIVLQLEADASREIELEFALCTFDRGRLSGNVHLHSTRQGDGLVSYARHVSSPCC